MRGVLFQINSKVKEELLKTFDRLFKSNKSYPHDTIKHEDTEIDLSIHFQNTWQKTDMGYNTFFYFDDKTSIPQYLESGIVTIDIKKTEKITAYYFDDSSLSNYFLILGSMQLCNRVIKELHKMIYNDIKKNETIFRKVLFKFNEKTITRLKEDKSITDLSLVYVDDTDDTYVKSTKIVGKKNKDLAKTDEFVRLGEMSEGFKTVKCVSPKFQKIITFNEEGYIASSLAIEKYVVMVKFFLEQFEKNNMIEYLDLLLRG